MTDPDRFIADCWDIVRGLGRDDPKAAARAQMGWGLRSAGALVYRDGLIEIVAEAVPSKRILVMKRATNNPILCTDKAGLPFRWHGETSGVAAHVRVLASQVRDPG